MIIYVNGKCTTCENIFDLLEERSICPWYYASTKFIGRSFDQVTDEWINNHKTYYYINGKRYNFELK